MRPPPLSDRYQLESLLGRGGMAEVWRGRDLRLDRPVAVKILTQGGLADPTAVERFRREAVTVARLAHPNIVSGYDFGGGDRPYLVMELVEGRSLEELLAEGPLPVAEATRVAAQVCAALEAAHSAGVIHRDIKPGNLLITPDGTVKVLDFGIARLQSATQAGLTRTATVVGTSHYMAPEQATGGESDARTDLYALGCVLYAMLAGTSPFDGENPMGVMYQHLHSAPAPVRERRAEVPPALDALVGRLLAKDPAQRPGSASDVRAGLAAASAQPGHTSVMPTLAQTATPASGFSGRATVPPPTGPAGGGYPEVEGETRWRHAGRGLPLPVVIGGAVAGVIALLLLVLVLTSGSEQTPDAKAPPTQTSDSPSPSPSASPTPSPTAEDPAGRLAELRSELGRQIDAGAIDGEAADKLSEMLDKIGEDLRKGKPDDAAKHLREFRKKLGEFVEDGRVSAAARTTLDRYADRLAQVLPRDGGDDEGDGDEDREDGRGNGRGRGNDKKDDD